MSIENKAEILRLEELYNLMVKRANELPPRTDPFLVMSMSMNILSIKAEIISLAQQNKVCEYDGGGF